MTVHRRQMGQPHISSVCDKSARPARSSLRHTTALLRGLASLTQDTKWIRGAVEEPAGEAIRERGPNPCRITKPHGAARISTRREPWWRRLDPISEAGPTASFPLGTTRDDGPSGASPMRQDRPGPPEPPGPIQRTTPNGWGVWHGSGATGWVPDARSGGRSIPLPFGPNGWRSVPVGATRRSNILLAGFPAAMLDLRTAPRHDCAGLTEG